MLHIIEKIYFGLWISYSATVKKVLQLKDINTSNLNCIVKMVMIYISRWKILLIDTIMTKCLPGRAVM